MKASRPEPWAVTDAPEAFVEAQMKGIVGIEIPIARIEGKWKVSQNRPEADRRGVVDGLSAEGDEASAGNGRASSASAASRQLSGAFFDRFRC